MTNNESTLYGIDLKDRKGYSWQLSPEAIDEEEALYLTQIWMIYIAMFCISPLCKQLVCIIHSAHVHIKGYDNKKNVMKERWIQLSTDFVVSVKLRC